MTDIPPEYRDADLEVDFRAPGTAAMLPVILVMFAGLVASLIFLAAPWSWIAAALCMAGLAPVWSEISKRLVSGNLWAFVRDLVVGAFAVIRRTRIVMRIQSLPPDVTDADALHARLFPDPPQSVDHRQTRDAFVQGVLSRPATNGQPGDDDWTRRQAWLLTMAQSIQPLERWGDDPLAALRRVKAPKPTPAPVAEAASATPMAFIPTPRPQGFLSMPLPGNFWAPIAMGLGVFSVVAVMWGLWQGERVVRAQADLRVAEQSALGWKDRATQSAGAAEMERVARAQAEESALRERERSAEMMRSQRARLERQNARNGERNDANTRPEPLNFDDRLRQLAEPSSAAAVPGVPAAEGDSASAAGVPAPGNAAPESPR